MAMTFSFALLGAMLFVLHMFQWQLHCFKTQEENPNSFSNRLINKLNSLVFYQLLNVCYKTLKSKYFQTLVLF